MASYNPSSSQAGAGQSGDISIDFNAMLARSMQEQQGAAEQAPGGPPASTGYEGVYNAAPASGPFEPGNVLGSGAAQQQQPVMPTELPVQNFLTSTMLLDFVDKKVYVVLRDNKAFIGVLRSYDQFANLTLTETIERHTAPNPRFGTDPTAKNWLLANSENLGAIMIRGENVAWMATVDLDNEDDLGKGKEWGDLQEVRQLQAAEEARQREELARQTRALRRHGMEPDQGMAG